MLNMKKAIAALSDNFGSVRTGDRRSGRSRYVCRSACRMRFGQRRLR